MRPMIPQLMPARVVAPPRGFALLITITLLAFAVLVLLGLATLTRIETAVAANSQRALEARQNAQLALQAAIGQLQEFAGVDQRVTARADLLSATTGNPYWTGVWDSTAASGDPLTWLVSGNEIEPLAVTPGLPPVADPVPGNDSVWLLHTPVGSAGQRIKLARQPLQASGVPGFDGPRTIGHYAWWVGDEGVKARFNLASPYAGAAAGSAGGLPQFMSAQQSGLEQLASGLANYVAAKSATTAGAALRTRLGHVLTPEQIVYADTSFALSTVRDRFHDVTTCSRGVLANARDGGLKKDLTRGLEAAATEPSGEVFPGGPDWALLRSFYQLCPALANGVSQIMPRAQSAVQQGVYPVVVLVQIVWGGDRVNGRFRLLFRPMIVLGNPYNVALAPADYRLIWRQSGIIVLQNPPSAANAPSVGGVPASLVGEDPQFLFSQIGFLPGEARVFTLPATGGSRIPYLAGTGVALAAGYSDASCVCADLATPADPSATGLRVAVSSGSAGFDFFLGDGSRLQSVSDCTANAPDSSGTMPLLGAPVRVGLRLSESSRNSPDDTSGLRWLASFNLRAREIGSLAAWGGNPQYDDATPAGGDAKTILGANDVFWGPSHSAAGGGQRFATLYSLPCADLHSLAQLQHANLQPANTGPGCTVGHSYADPHTADGTPDFDYRLNEELWDRFFFSTVPAGSGALPAALPNSRIVYYRPRGLPPDPAAVRNCGTAAAHLLVDGPFNLNSTSVEAWQALLASLNGQSLAWTDPGTGNAVTATVASAFLRSPVVNGGDADGWRGYRALSAADVRRLALAIVQRNPGPRPVSFAGGVRQPAAGGADGRRAPIRRAASRARQHGQSAAIAGSCVRPASRGGTESRPGLAGRLARSSFHARTRLAESGRRSVHAGSPAHRAIRHLFGPRLW